MGMVDWGQVMGFRGRIYVMLELCLEVITRLQKQHVLLLSIVAEIKFALVIVLLKGIVAFLIAIII